MLLLNLKRKFPKFTGVLNYSKRVVNAKIVASNHQDFRDSVIAGIIVRNPLMEYDTLTMKTIGKYRYWKYLSPDSGYCNVAELKFIQNGINISHKGKILVGGEHVGSRMPENVFDNDELTYYQSKSANGGWIALDFGEAVQVDHVKYIPRNDDNNVKPADSFELLYWNVGKWESLGVKKSTSDSLVYNTIPSKALYLLRNHTRGKRSVFSVIKTVCNSGGRNFNFVFDFMPSSELYPEGKM